MIYKLSVWSIISCLSGIIFFAIGVVNTFWGNDPPFGVGIILLSFIYFPPVTAIVKRIVGISIPAAAKVVLGIFILWASLGVGELFAKIDLMMKSI